jgi:hypothetical protein
MHCVQYFSQDKETGHAMNAMVTLLSFHWSSPSLSTSLQPALKKSSWLFTHYLPLFTAQSSYSVQLKNGAFKLFLLASMSCWRSFITFKMDPSSLW